MDWSNLVPFILAVVAVIINGNDKSDKIGKWE